MCMPKPKSKRSLQQQQQKTDGRKLEPRKEEKKEEEQTTFDIENVRMRTIVGCHAKYDSVYMCVSMSDVNNSNDFAE